MNLLPASSNLSLFDSLNTDNSLLDLKFNGVPSKETSVSFSTSIPLSAWLKGFDLGIHFEPNSSIKTKILIDKGNPSFRSSLDQFN